MATYFWDLGFDFNAEAKNGKYFLQNGFVLLQPPSPSGPNNVPATPVNLKAAATGVPGDLIGFNAFNVTNPLGTGTYSVSGTITFQSAVTGQSESSPFGSNTINFPERLAPDSTGYSVIFSGVQASDPGRSNPATFPTYYGPRVIIGGTLLEVVNNGRFLMSVSLTVKNTVGGVATTKTFAVDPEMVVGGAG